MEQNGTEDYDPAQRVIDCVKKAGYDEHTIVNSVVYTMLQYMNDTQRLGALAEIKNILGIDELPNLLNDLQNYEP